MAQNLRSGQEPTRSASEEEEEASSEEGSESGSESEPENKSSPPTPPATKNPPLLSSSKKIPPPPPPESESDSESGSYSDSEPESILPSLVKKSGKADPNIKPIATKPMDAAKNPRSKPPAPSSPPPAKSDPGGKRPAAEAEGKDSKRAKKKVPDSENGAKKGSGGEDGKKQLFQRIWSEEDEIALLKGIIDYSNKKGVDPLNDVSDFQNFVKKSLHVDFSNIQLSDKIKRMRKKYANNKSKEKKGKERVLPKAHEQKCYELSKKIWGSDVGTSSKISSPKANGTEKKDQNQRNGKGMKLNGVDVQKEMSKKEIEGNEEPSGSVRMGKGFGARLSEDDIMQEAFKWIEGPKRVELEEKWKALQIKEMELVLMRSELIVEQTKEALAAIKAAEE